AVVSVVAISSRARAHDRARPHAPAARRAIHHVRHGVSGIRSESRSFYFRGFLARPQISRSDYRFGSFAVPSGWGMGRNACVGRVMGQPVVDVTHLLPVTALLA